MSGVPAATTGPRISREQALQVARRDLWVRVGFVVALINLSLLPVWLDRHGVISKQASLVLWVAATAVLGGIAIWWHVRARRSLAAMDVVDAYGRVEGPGHRVVQRECTRRFRPRS